MEIKYSLSNDTWDELELAAIERVIKSNSFTMGAEVRKYEREFAARFGSKYAVMSNSGSSANLLMMFALIYSNRLQKGDEVLVPAISWGTTYFPIEQCGLKTRLVDIDKNTLNIDASKLEKAITSDTKALLAVNLLGNPNDFDLLASMCKKHNLILLEDNCESMGAKYHGKETGTFGLMGTFSTFYSHHLSTMEGGVTITDDEEMYHYLLSIRAHGWTRQLPQNSKLWTKSEDEFYESFRFIMPGFNVRPLEIEAAIGSEQLRKLDAFLKVRRDNAVFFLKAMQNNERFSVQTNTDDSSWFGFALVLKTEYVGQRDKYIKALRQAGIEVRPIVTGNFAKQPAFKYMNASISGILSNADYIHDNGFFVGNHSIPMDKQIILLRDALSKVE
ncbi:MAG: DegT/DnrJ/EryC1/StrS family aminotransferase [Bacilli bacterium]|jgi:CDP-6-deoxy-D-xylo-4-hexulose-3-dehydrase